MVGTNCVYSGVCRKGSLRSCLREADVNGWIVITRDDRIRYKQLEKQAVIADAGALILSALDKTSRLCRLHSKREFIAKISRGPDVKIIETSRK
jgi:hypothetical protein